MNLNRLPNQWHAAPNGTVLPCIVWHALWPSGYAAVNHRHLEQFASGRFDMTLDPNAEAALSSLAMRVSLDLQTGHMMPLPDWAFAIDDSLCHGAMGYSCIVESDAIECGQHAFMLLNALMRETHADEASFLSRATALIEAASTRLRHKTAGASALAVLVEARSRGIPVSALSRRMPAYRLGYGSKQKRLWRSFTSSTSHLGTVLATHKPLTHELLQACGLPVPQQIRVRTQAEARAAARSIGYPVVVKPSNTDFGTAVTTGIADQAMLDRAFAQAQEHGEVLVEEHVCGTDYRLTVVDGRCVDVECREPPMVVGNGVDSIARLAEALAEQRRRNPTLRGFASASTSDALVLDTLQHQGLKPDDVPEAGVLVQLRTNANVSTGGSLRRVTEQAHPDNLRLAERAARVLDLDCAGIDLLTPDISRSWREAGGAICEVNPTPGLSGTGAHRDLIDYLFPDPVSARMPILLLVGSTEALEEFRTLIAKAASARGWRIGSAVVPSTHECAESYGDGLGDAHALISRILVDPEVDLMLLQCSANHLIHHGLELAYFDLCVFDIDDDAARLVRSSPRSVVGRSPRIRVRPSLEQITEDLRALGLA